MKHLKTFMVLLVLLGALSCTKTRITSDGTLTFTLSPAYDLVEVTKSTVSDYATLPQTSEFALVIKDDAGKETWSGLLSEWDPTTQLLAGDAAPARRSIASTGAPMRRFPPEKVADRLSTMMSAPILRSSST